MSSPAIAVDVVVCSFLANYKFLAFKGVVCDIELI